MKSALEVALLLLLLYCKRRVENGDVVGWAASIVAVAPPSVRVRVMLEGILCVLCVNGGASPRRLSDRKSRRFSFLF